MEGTERHEGGTSMYVELLRDALRDWIGKLSVEELVNFAITCRVESLRTPKAPDDHAVATLAAQITFDRALVKLAESLELDVPLESFDNPARGRRRLEQRLRDLGYDLVALARR